VVLNKEEDTPYISTRISVLVVFWDQFWDQFRDQFWDYFCIWHS